MLAITEMKWKNLIYKSKLMYVKHLAQFLVDKRLYK